MIFNVTKCHSMRETRHYSHKQILHDYTLHQQTLENVQSVIYIGIKWIGLNISLIFHPKQLRLKVFFAGTWLTNEVANKTLVRPKYTARLWSPYCETQIQQVEKVQKTATRWTGRRWHNTSSVCEMLDELQWPALEASTFLLQDSSGICLLIKTST